MGELCVGEGRKRAPGVALYNTMLFGKRIWIILRNVPRTSFFILCNQWVICFSTPFSNFPLRNIPELACFLCTHICHDFLLLLLLSYFKVVL